MGYWGQCDVVIGLLPGSCNIWSCCCCNSCIDFNFVKIPTAQEQGSCPVHSIGKREATYVLIVWKSKRVDLVAMWVVEVVVVSWPNKMGEGNFRSSLCLCVRVCV